MSKPTSKQPSPSTSAITFSKVSQTTIGSNKSKLAVSVPKKKVVRKKKSEESNTLTPVTNHWGYTFAQDESGKQILVMLEGPSVPQDILDELRLSSDQRKEDEIQNSNFQEEEFQDFPVNAKISESEIPVTLVPSGSLKSKGRSSQAAQKDSKTKIKGKGKTKGKKKKDSKPVLQVDSAGDASSTQTSSTSCSICSSNGTTTSLDEQEVPKWMDDAIADFIRSNIKSPRLERECGLRSCTEWLKNYNKKYRSVREISSCSSVGDDSSGVEDNLDIAAEPSFSELFTEIGDDNHKMQIRFYPDFSDFFGEIPTRAQRPPTRIYVEDYDRSQSFDFLYDDGLSDQDKESESTESSVPSFAKFDNPKLKKALAKLRKLEKARILRDYHVPARTPLHCCAKGGPPPEGRKTSTNKQGPPLGPFYRCPINHITGIVLRRPKIRLRKRGRRFDSGRRPHFLPFHRDFLRRKEGKDCCSCDKWKGRLGVGNLHDTDNYHQNYLNFVTYNKEAQIPCRSDRCERCRLLATRSPDSSKCRARPKIMNSYNNYNMNRKGPLVSRHTPLFKTPPSRQHNDFVVNAQLTAGTLASKAKITVKKNIPLSTTTLTSNSNSKSRDKKPDWK